MFQSYPTQGSISLHTTSIRDADWPIGPYTTPSKSLRTALIGPMYHQSNRVKPPPTIPSCFSPLLPLHLPSSRSMLG